MKHIGIITEYNPFHNGHAYQLKKARELFPEKNIIIIMSGNYVQRGEPAIYNKYLRTQCALQNKADIIFELPILFATASAEHFASSAVLAFSKIGVVDTLCFGAETDDLAILTHIAHLLVKEPEGYKHILQDNLKAGFSFPKARAAALSTYTNQSCINDILRQPNNILAIEYLKAIERYNLKIKPVIIKRIGSGYHDITANNIYSSATAIRTGLQQSDFNYQHTMPEEAATVLQNDIYAKPLFSSDFYNYLQYAIWNASHYLEDYYEVSEELANKLRSIHPFPKEYEELVNHLSSKQYTATRIQRALLNILLGNTRKDMDSAKERNYITYLRLLGFKKGSSTILKEMKKTSNIPIINKVANAHTILSKDDIQMFEQELRQNQLYTQVFSNKYEKIMRSEYEHSVIISN